MNFFKDAEAFMKNRKPAENTTAVLNLSTPESYATLFAECRHLYENATKQEIERAIEQTREELSPPYPHDVFMKKIRVKLED